MLMAVVFHEKYVKREKYGDVEVDFSTGATQLFSCVLALKKRNCGKYGGAAELASVFGSPR